MGLWLGLIGAFLIGVLLCFEPAPGRLPGYPDSRIGINRAGRARN